MLNYYNNLNGKTCLARIVSSDSIARTVACKTIGLVGVTDDLYLSNVKILHNAYHPEGDEETYIPRIGSYAVLIFINSEPYIVGYYPPPASEGVVEREAFEKLEPGDKVIKTVGGNRIVLRAGGVVEVKSTEHCRTLYIPSENRITTVASNTELEVDGGNVYWDVDPETHDTLLTHTAWDSMDVDTMSILELGATNHEDEDVFLDFAIGDSVKTDETDTQSPPTEIETRTWQMQISWDGTTHMEVGDEENLTIDIEPDGETVIEIGPGKVILTMKPDGTVKLETTSDITIDCGGDLTVDVAGDTSITTSGDTDITTSGDTAIDTTGDTDITTGGSTTIDTSGDTDITSGGSVTVDAGGSVTVTAGGSAEVTAGGPATVDAPSIALNGQSGMVLTTMTDPLVDMITGAPTTGVPTVTAG